MKIVFLIDDLGSGGAQRQLVQLSLALKKMNHQLTVLSYFERDHYKETLNKHGITTICLEHKNPFKRIITFRNFIRLGNYDVVMSFLGVPNFLNEVAAIPFKNWKLIVNERSADPVILKSYNSKFRRIFHFFADVIVCNSNSNKFIVLKVNPLIREKKIRVIYNMIDLEVWKPFDDFKYRKDGILHILVAASHRKLKNLMGLLQGLMLLDKEIREQIRISWYGDSLEEPYYDNSIELGYEFISQNNLAQLISFFPAIHDIREKMQTSDVIGLFSHFEGLPNAICEGMALGKPILASAVSDIPLLINDGISGKLFNPKDVQSIADALRYFLHLDNNKLKEMGRLNREKASVMFDEKKDSSTVSRIDEMKTFKPTDFFVFGYFGFVTNQIDGQTVKTRMVHRLFEEYLGDKVPIYDTESLKSNKIGLIKAILNITRVRYVIYLPARNNLKRFLPFLVILSQIFKFQIHYFVIGGWLPHFIEKNKNIERKLKKISWIYVETRKMEDLLTNKLNFSNITWFPNFRFTNPEIPQKTKSEKLNMVYLSRISIEKGIDTIFWFLDSLTDDRSTLKFQIDFYGPIDENDKDFFDEQIKLHQAAGYRGIAEPDSVQRVLAGYDLLVFPTRYEGEGCPGIIIDAYFSGIPVLATNWKYNSEFVIDCETGYLFDINDKMKFRRILLELAENKSCLIEMGMKARDFSKKFDSENALKIIKANLNPLCT